MEFRRVLFRSPIAAREGAFGTLLARYRKYFRRELALPFGVGLDDFLHLDNLPLLSIIGEQHQRDPKAGAARSRIRRPMLASPRNRDQPREGQRSEERRAGKECRSPGA